MDIYILRVDVSDATMSKMRVRDASHLTVIMFTDLVFDIERSCSLMSIDDLFKTMHFPLAVEFLQESVQCDVAADRNELGPSPLRP